MKIAILYTRMAGYFYESLQVFAKTYRAEILIIAQKPDPNAPYQFEDTTQIRIEERNAYSGNKLIERIDTFHPDIIYMTGWTDSQYLKIGRQYKRRIPVVMGMDNYWRNTLKQHLASWIGPYYLKSACTHLWIPGLYQFEFARRLGFKKDEIITGLYCAHVEPFFEAYETKARERLYPRTLLYVGRLVERKWIKELADAFLEIDRPDWRLLIVGNGPESDHLPKDSRIERRAFVPPDQLPEIAKEAGAFCIPSTYDPWGVVLHEFAAAGLPLVASDAVGAHTAFLKHGYNGFLFKTNDHKGLRAALKNIMDLSNEEQMLFGRRSKELAQQITPESWSATLMSVMDV